MRLIWQLVRSNLSQYITLECHLCLPQISSSSSPSEVEILVLDPLSYRASGRDAKQIHVEEDEDDDARQPCAMAMMTTTTAAVVVVAARRQ